MAAWADQWWPHPRPEFHFAGCDLNIRVEPSPALPAVAHTPLTASPANSQASLTQLLLDRMNKVTHQPCEGHQTSHTIYCYHPAWSGGVVGELCADLK